MTSWVDLGTELEKRLPGHREGLDRLRMSALTYTDAERIADVASHQEELAQVDELRKQRDETTNAPPAPESEVTGGAPEPLPQPRN